MKGDFTNWRAEAQSEIPNMDVFHSGSVTS